MKTLFHPVAESGPEVGGVYDARANQARDVKMTIPPCARPEIDARLLAILDAPAHGETLMDAFKRKEREIGGVFAGLTPVESLAMERRLGNPAANDELAQKFARLVVDRRNRLLAFLAECRRSHGGRRVA